MLELRKQGTKGVHRMGTYLNPGNGGFERIAKSGYIDKTGMIGIINSRINTTSNLIGLFLYFLIMAECPLFLNLSP